VETVEWLVGSCTDQQVALVPHMMWPHLRAWYDTMHALPWIEIGTYQQYVMYCEIPLRWFTGQP
jgi:hypothetical protein